MVADPNSLLERQRLIDENSALRAELDELRNTFEAVSSGEIDALVVNGDLFTLQSAGSSAQRLREDVLGQMRDAVLAVSMEGRLIYLNPAAERQYRVTSSDALGRLTSTLFAEVLQADAREQSNESVSLRATHRLPDGTTVEVESTVSDLVDEAGCCIGHLAVVRDVSDRVRHEARRNALTDLAERLRDIDDASEVAFLAACTLGQYLGVGRAGYASVEPGTELVSIDRHWCAEGVEALPSLVNLRDYGSFVDSLNANVTVRIENVALDSRTAGHVPALLSRGVQSLVNLPIVERGRLVAFFFVNHVTPRQWTDDEVSFVQEVADRTRASAERAAAVQALRLANDRLESAVEERTNELMAAQEALRQSQKMEAIGQLTGGIAHDFNNLLGGMSAALQVLQARLKLGKFDNVERYLGMAQDSIKRASALTQRLLAFARRQTLDSKPIDVNRLLNGLEELISRSVGPDVQVEVVGSGGLWTTKVDPSQLENSVLNLCINARDAMLPGGGRLTIETANKWFDGRLAAERELVPGQYVSVCVTDTGSGMTQEVAQRIFDPFFTTKPLGQGTGLGLSMVYGFVRQSGGQVRVYSELGKGTTMCLYLPRHLGEPDEELAQDRSEFVGGGDGESILLIEDEETIRLVVSEMLVEAGYKVATAEDGPSGLRILEQANHVDFLITDVGLPGGLNGRQVADAARRNRPDLKVLFITGYAENAAVGDGHLERGMEVLTKPFDIGALVAKVRAMMR